MVCGCRWTKLNQLIFFPLILGILIKFYDGRLTVLKSATF